MPNHAHVNKNHHQHLCNDLEDALYTYQGECQLLKTASEAALTNGECCIPTL